ncbi:hypothetical protein REPUB_Repub03eG0188200 [Reevesia pubescens]
MAPMKTLLILFICIDLLTLSQGSKDSKLDDLEEDVSFLESQETNDSQQSHDSHQNYEKVLGDLLNNLPNPEDQLPWPSVDEKDVIVLNKENFSEVIEKNRYVLVEFYSPSCWHCQALTADYAAAATELKGEVLLAKVDGTQEAELLQKFEIKGFPTLFLFFNGVRKAYEGERTKDDIVTWVKKQTGPGVYNITTTEEAESILVTESIVALGFVDSLMLLLFATSHDSQNIKPTFLDAAKSFKGKLIFVYVEMDNQDIGKQVLDYFGVSGNAQRVLAFTTDDNNKYIMDGHLTLSNIKSFAKDFLEDELQPYYKSDSIPEKNDGDVKIVVGKNFDEIVLDESKDVLLEIYAPWCRHCQTLEPIYSRVGKYLRGIDSLVITKMDGTTNEHPCAKINVDTDSTAVAFYKFLREHASFPFKLHKLAAASVENIKQSDSADDQKISNDMNMKEEL